MDFKELLLEKGFSISDYYLKGNNYWYIVENDKLLIRYRYGVVEICHTDTFDRWASTQKYTIDVSKLKHDEFLIDAILLSVDKAKSYIEKNNLDIDVIELGNFYRQSRRELKEAVTYNSND